MRDDHQPAPQRPDPALQTLEAVEVEIVGRLVQQGQVEVRELDAGQRHPGPLATRQRRHRPVGQVDTESDLVEGRVDAGVEVADTQSVEALQCHLVAPLGRAAPGRQPGGRLGQFGLGPSGPGASGQVVADRLPRWRLVLLGQVAHRGRRRVPDDGPGVGLDRAGQELEQRGLADAVGPDHADAAVRADGDRDSVDDRAAAPVEGDVARHQRGLAATGCYGEVWSGVRATEGLSDRWTDGHGITGSQRTSPRLAPPGPPWPRRDPQPGPECPRPLAGDTTALASGPTSAGQGLSLPTTHMAKNCEPPP